MLYILNQEGYFLSTNLDIQPELEDCTCFDSEEDALLAYNQRAYGDNEEDHEYIEPIFVTIDADGKLTTTTLNDCTYEFDEEDKEEFLEDHEIPLTAANYINKWTV